MARRLLALVLLAVSATGCLLGPNYQRPPVVAPEHWLDTPAVDAATLANTPWWDLFQDPQLQELIRVALVENRDLRIAIERVEEARARYGYVRADLYPKLDLSAQGGVIGLSRDGLTPIPDSVAVTPGSGSPFSSRVVP